jgi:ribosome-binding protein aMBF1 (putative translation factor)
MERDMSKVQIIHDAKGNAAFAVVPWAEYERLRAAQDQDEDARLIALAQPHLHEETYPSEVVERVVAGEVALKVFREWRGLSQAELGAKAKVPAQYISQIERGVRNLGKVTAGKLEKVLKVSADLLVD